MQESILGPTRLKTSAFNAPNCMSHFKQDWRFLELHWRAERANLERTRSGFLEKYFVIFYKIAQKWSE